MQDGIVWDAASKSWLVYVNGEQVGEADSREDAIRIHDEYSVDAEFSTLL